MRSTLTALACCIASLPGLASAASQSHDAHAAAVALMAQPAPAGAAAYFIEPRDGARIKGPVKVVFGLSNMGVAPAGINQEKTGHHHLLINEPEVNLGLPLPASEQILHFGGGQTETELKLPPGRHTLQLLLGDWKHQPHNPPVLSDKITITVE